MTNGAYELRRVVLDNRWVGTPREICGYQLWSRGELGVPMTSAYRDIYALAAEIDICGLPAWKPTYAEALAELAYCELILKANTSKETGE